MPTYGLTPPDKRGDLKALNLYLRSSGPEDAQMGTGLSPAGHYRKLRGKPACVHA